MAAHFRKMRQVTKLLCTNYCNHTEVGSTFIRGASTTGSNVNLPGEADVVVIGGGVLGCSTLYHLAKLGISNTVLLEAHKLTSGTTWHTAGMLSCLRSNETEIELVRTTRNILLRLEEETGVNPGWINNGTLLVADSQDRMDEYKHLMSIGKAHGIEATLLDPMETLELYPLMNVDDLVGSMLIPADGIIDPTGYCMGMVRFAKRAGAQVLEDCPVSDIHTVETLLGGRKVTEVHTPHGVIKTSAVVNATGSWANRITNMVGVELPLTVYEHIYVVTEKIPGVDNNLPNVRETKTSCYVKLQGDALTVGGFESSPVRVNEAPMNSPFHLYEMNWGAFGELLEGAIRRVPVLETAGIKSTISGPETFTPDHHPIMGEDPNIQGFFHCCAFNSYGMRVSGGCGDQMAKWIAYGRPEIDMFSYDVRRLHTPLSRNKEWVNSKVHETFAHRYAIHYKHSEPLAGRGQRLSPLHKVLEEQGCIFQERSGWERPSWFHSAPAPVQPYDWSGCYGVPQNTDMRYIDAIKQDSSYGLPAQHDVIGKECLSCRNAAAIFDVSHFGKYFLTGPDAQKAADWLFSAKVDKDNGSTIYTCMLNSKGGIEADLTVSICRGEDSLASEPTFEGRGFYLVTGTTTATYNYAHIMKEIRKHKWNVQMFNCTDDVAVISIQGPRSRDILQSLSQNDFSNDAFLFSTNKLVTIAGHLTRAMRLTFVGEMGWELHMPKALAVPVYNALMEAGRPFGMVNAGYRAQDSLAAEKGYRRWHADIRPDDSPLECGLTFTCKLKSDTNFLGRKALEELMVRGPSRKLVTLTLNDPTRPLWGNEVISRDGDPVGFIRRAEYAFTLGRTIGFGYVERPDGERITRDFLESGTWKIESMGDQLEATCHLKHPFDPQSLRVKGFY